MVNHLLFPPDLNPEYCWIIDVDHLWEPVQGQEEDRAGTLGPRYASEEMIHLLQSNKKAGRQFRMYDDDGELYYTGRILGVVDDDSIFVVDELAFAPLQDFGAPDAGAVDIQYKNQAGAWQSL